jgi:hypothetical protein
MGTRDFLQYICIERQAWNHHHRSRFLRVGKKLAIKTGQALLKALKGFDFLS